METNITAHKLAEILLKCKDVPVVIPSVKENSDAELIVNIFLAQHTLSPFEYVILLENQHSLGNDGYIEISD